jgi:hypothetical protein
VFSSSQFTCPVHIRPSGTCSCVILFCGGVPLQCYRRQSVCSNMVQARVRKGSENLVSQSACQLVYNIAAGTVQHEGLAVHILSV